MNRRTFLTTTTAALHLDAQAPPSARPSLCLFSKHAGKLDYKDLAKFSKQTGFDGVDLTVRPGGHVLPEKVTDDLPVAVAILESSGLKVPMITTGLTNPKAPETSATLRKAGELKIPFWKPGYFRYETSREGVVDIDRKLAEVQIALGGFALLSRIHNICAGFHNHSGSYVGAPVWDTWNLISLLDANHIGFYFDAAHATAEGGEWTWHSSLEIALKRMKMLAVKDFYWEKDKGKWKMRWCPLGQGMVDWPKVMSRLALAKFNGPVTLHVEYETPNELKAVADDFAVMKKLVDDAYGKA
ncbi:sugar phosphate isomerase/epimerase family protein [Bryobacter aggregatus]|uniref:sugar phosphate isomerase/epimerase family protein n=1 Tax=Bryobacter aggregatus TaxID=360054 RepID=UPI0004E100F2|nr:TIM barrel protein [Bryobacter aggregatus]